MNPLRRYNDGYAEHAASPELERTTLPLLEELNAEIFTEEQLEYLQDVLSDVLRQTLQRFVPIVLASPPGRTCTMADVGTNVITAIRLLGLDVPEDPRWALCPWKDLAKVLVTDRKRINRQKKAVLAAIGQLHPRTAQALRRTLEGAAKQPGGKASCWGQKAKKLSKND